MGPPRISTTTRMVLAVFLAEPAAPRYGLELCRLAGLASGTIHPILARLETADWLTSAWEDIDPVAAGRPARRYYRFTPPGEEQARAALAARPLANPLPIAAAQDAEPIARPEPLRPGGRSARPRPAGWGTVPGMAGP